MKRLIPHIAIVCLTGLTATNSMTVMAGGCSSHMNKKAEIECAESDIDCQTEKTEKYGLNKTVRS